VIALLLDTCAAIWLTEGDPLSEDAMNALRESTETGVPVYLSPITAWEVGLLVARKRLTISMPPEAWFERLLSASGTGLAELTGRILVASSFLPGSPPRDPVDRIIIATARQNGYRIVTRDRHLLAYAKLGHANALAC
jgi:PIN domain nuclease of toxin-antitoxin system